MSLVETPAAMIIFITTILVSLYAMFMNQSFYARFMLNPYEVVNQKKWYLMITSGFLHADPMHLIFNMLTFYFFAFQLEYVLGSFGFVILYFGSMILADISTIIKNKENYGYRAVGASGAISGVVFSFILFAPTAMLRMFFMIPIPAALFGVLYLFYCAYAAKRSQDLINHEAHFWGAIAGVVITIILIPEVLPYFFNQIFGSF